MIICIPDGDLHQPGDPPSMTRAIDWLESKAITARRPSAYQLKVGRLNYYPAKETLQLDGEAKLSERGFEAFKRIVLDLTQP